MPGCVSLVLASLSSTTDTDWSRQAAPVGKIKPQEPGAAVSKSWGARGHPGSGSPITLPGVTLLGSPAGCSVGLMAESRQELSAHADTMLQ